MENGVQGTVVVEAVLDAAGDVQDARIVTGPAELRKAALQSVLQWHFVPAAAGTVRQVSITFDLAAARAQERPEPTNQFENRDVAYAFKKGERKQNREVQEQALNLQAEVAELKARLAQTQALLEQQAPGSDSPYRAQIVELQGRLFEMERKLENARTAGNDSAVTVSPGTFTVRTNITLNSASAAGRILRSIDIVGFPDGIPDGLRLRLPVRIGDTLTPELMEKTTKAVRSFDEHLEHNFTLEEGGEVSLRIAAPGREMRLILHQE